MLAVVTAWFATNKVRLLEYGAIVILILAVVFAIWFSMHQRQELAVELGRQQGLTKTLNAEIETLKAQIEAVRKQRDDQLSEFREIVERSDRLGQDLATIRADIAKRQEAITKHDLGAIGAKKPGLLEPRINAATRDQFKRIEEATRP